MIRRLIDGVIVRQYEKEICDVDIDVIESGEYKVYLITVTFDIDPFQVMANAFGGSSVQEDIMNDIFMLLDSNFDIQPSLKRKYVRGCKDSQKQEQTEGLHDTSWENDEGDKITLIDLLDATKHIPVKKIFLNKIKSKLIKWDGNDKEIAKIEKADLQYPILIFVDDNNKFISIIDGHHRAHKALRKGLKKINAKIIPINSLPKNIRKVFKGMGKQEEMTEGELTEKCWKGYTQKGMKTMFGKRYPNCVKKTK